MGEVESSVNDLSRKVIGAAIEVHRTLGPGFLESVYEEALCVELRVQHIPYLRQVFVNITYKDSPVGEGRIDLVIANRLILELKAVEALAPVHTAQVISYLKALRLKLGILINFNVPILYKGIKRVVLTERTA